MLKKKYDKSDMKKSMQKQYGKEEGKKVYFATIRKQAMEGVAAIDRDWETQVEKIQEEVRPEISVEFPNAIIDESGTIVPKEDETSSLNLNVNPNSRLATGFNMAAPNQTTMERGQQLFSGPGEITFAAKGGIMSTKKAFQRVA